MFILKKIEIKESKQLVQAAIGNSNFHVHGDGPEYQIKFDIWIIGYAEFKNGKIIFTPRPDGKHSDGFKSFMAHIKRQYRKK